MAKRRLKGIVTSDKMEKAVVVAVERTFAHPIYKKRVKKTKRYKAHDEVGAEAGDRVVIEETRPISKGKCWRVVEIGGKPISKQQTANSEQQEGKVARRAGSRSAASAKRDKPKARSSK